MYLADGKYSHTYMDYNYIGPSETMSHVGGYSLGRNAASPFRKFLTMHAQVDINGTKKTWSFQKQGLVFILSILFLYSNQPFDACFFIPLPLELYFYLLSPPYKGYLDYRHVTFFWVRNSIHWDRGKKFAMHFGALWPKCAEQSCSLSLKPGTLNRA